MPYISSTVDYALHQVLTEAVENTGLNYKQAEIIFAQALKDEQVKRALIKVIAMQMALNKTRVN